MKLKKKLTTGNMMDFEEVFFPKKPISENGDGPSDDEEEGQVGTYFSASKAVEAAIIGGWFADVDSDSDPPTIMRATDSDEFLERASEVIEIYKSKKMAEAAGADPNS
jgi:hypothetical protein